MQKEELSLLPDYIFETSWEVCNKMGGIYTVLSTRAKTMQKQFADRVIFIGPDFGNDYLPKDFLPDETLFTTWKDNINKNLLRVRTGRWNIPGYPIGILVDFNPFYEIKNQIYADMWNAFGVDSLHAYGDYDEASMFGYASGYMAQSFYNYYLKAQNQSVIFHANEWMTAMGLLYIKKHVPQIATVFTTHATGIGRSISSNNKELYRYLKAYNGTQMAEELNIQSKHSVERQAAHHAHCFTTVSDITGMECTELLDKTPDVILPNGFENDFVPKGITLTNKRRAARKRIFKMANALTGKRFAEDTLIISTSGRYEWRNKGIDVFIQTLADARDGLPKEKQILALIEVPAWTSGARNDLKERMEMTVKKAFDTPLDMPFVTHQLMQPANDPVIQKLDNLHLNNHNQDNRVTCIFVPSYLNGDDGILNLNYYDLLIGKDLCIYPSYYEPWGYTPLEAIAFHVPCVTTDLSGFGLWVNKQVRHEATINDGVAVIHRDDLNTEQVSKEISQTILTILTMDKKQKENIRKKAQKLSQKALWKHFFKYYNKAYTHALLNLK